MTDLIVGNNLNSFLFCLVMMFVLSFQVVKADDNTYESYLKEGDEYYMNFDNLSAINEYENAYQLSGDNFEILAKLALSNNDYGEDLKNNGKPGAAKYFEDSIKYGKLLKRKYPEKAEGYFFVASAYGNYARYRGGKDKVKLARYVEENAKKAISLNQDFVPPYIILGIYYREIAKLNRFLKAFANTFLGGLPNGTYFDSIQMLKKAAELSPEKIYAHFELAETYRSINDGKNAQIHYLKVLELPVSDHQDKWKKEKALRILKRTTVSLK